MQGIVLTIEEANEVLRVLGEIPAKHSYKAISIIQAKQPVEIEEAPAKTEVVEPHTEVFP